MKKTNTLLLKNIIVLLVIILFTIMLFKQLNKPDTYSSDLSSTNTTSEYLSKSIEPIYSEEDSNLISLTTSEINELSTLSYNEKLEYLYDSKYNLETRLKIFLGSSINNIGLIYYNFDTTQKISFNENEDFIAASTYKVGLNILYYYLASINKINLDDTITYNYDDYESGTGVLQNYDYIGSVSISELLDLSLIYSDNIATNMLGRYLGGHSTVRKMLYDLLDINYLTSENNITPEIEFKILSYLYNNKIDTNFAHMINVLTNTEFNDRMDKYLPSSIVAHKVGTYDTYIHDVGIILDQSPYLLIIYTEGLTNADEIIAQISAAIYEYNITL